MGKRTAHQAGAKAWVAGVLVPFVVLGAIDLRTQSQRTRTQTLYRDASGSHIPDPRRPDLRRRRPGDRIGRRAGAQRQDRRGLRRRHARTGESLKAELVEAAGKTVMPGLIDVHVHLGAPGGVYADPKDYLSPDAMPRALAQYLYSGVTTVKSAGDALDTSIATRDRIARGERLGAELFVSGPMFTAAGGHGTEYAQFMPANVRAAFEARSPARRETRPRRDSRFASSRPRAWTA